MLTPYRSDLPPELWNLAADLISGKFPERNYGLHVGHEILGYVLGQAFPDGPVIAGEAPMACTDHTLAECCRDQARGIKRGAFPWFALAAKILAILAELMNKEVK